MIREALTHGLQQPSRRHRLGRIRIAAAVHEFDVFTTDSSWGPLAVIPSRHLTGVWGNPTVPISRLGTAIRNVVSDRQRAG